MSVSVLVAIRVQKGAPELEDLELEVAVLC